MENVMDKMVVKRAIWTGESASLRELGFTNCGLDDNWQACGTGVKGSFHAADGTPLVNTTIFPDMKKMVDYGHALKLYVGWCK
jgi:alpha-galactosidase